MPPRMLGGFVGACRATLPMAWPLLALACSSPSEPEPAITVVTDSTEYYLDHPGYDVNRVRIGVRISNPTGHPVYLHRACGSRDAPGAGIVRSPGDTTPAHLTYHHAICDGMDIPRPPIPLQSGETQTYELEFYRSVGGPPVPPMAWSTGRFRVIVVIQPTDAYEGWGAVDPLPIERTSSNEFVIHPPVEGG